MENKLLNEVEQNNSCLSKVSAFYNYYDGKLSNDIEMLSLDFSGLLVRVVVSSDDDCLHILSNDVTSTYDVEKDLSCIEPWINCIGSFIREYYIMTNNRGYDDALQFEFAETGEIIQLYGIASRIDIRSVISVK